MIRSIVRTVPILLAAGAAVIAAAPASAIQYDTANSVVVRHGDLDLTTDKGVGMLNNRIAAASRAVCGSFEPIDLKAKAQVTGCRKLTVASTAPKVELAVAAARSGQQLAAAAITIGKSVP